MEKELIDLIKINRDAVSTNRGFYYQYLHVLSKWINNYINDQNIDIYTEVDDDIKEVGEELIFTQLKCYSSVFSFNSPEIQKTLLNFFCQYLEYHNQIENLTFKFITNTSLSRNEKLLRKWIEEQPLISVELVNQCASKISQIIILCIDEVKKKRLNKGKLNPKEIKKILHDFGRLNNIAQDDKIISDFVCKIRWEFGNEDPEVAVELLLIKILAKLENSAFEKRPPKLLLDVMLSEIYRKSQLSDPKQRKVNNSILQSILDSNDMELFTYVDTRLISLFGSRLEILEIKVTEITEKLSHTVNLQEKHELIINQIVQDSFSKYCCTTYNNKNSLRRSTIYYW